MGRPAGLQLTHEIEDATMSAPNAILAGDGLASGAGMAAMALASVCLWTLRVACAARGRKLVGAAVAAVEAVAFAAAFSSLAANLDAPIPVFGYAVGVAAGTLLGLFIDERTSHRKAEIGAVLPGDDPPVEEALAGLGWPATSSPATGPRRSVTVAFVAVDEEQVLHVLTTLHRTFPDLFPSVRQLQRMHPSLHSPGLPPDLAADASPAVHRRLLRPIHFESNATTRNTHAHR
jgi:uncharacterized protein YebE (UPF0316 family)